MLLSARNANYRLRSVSTSHGVRLKLRDIAWGAKPSEITRGKVVYRAVHKGG